MRACKPTCRPYHLLRTPCQQRTYGLTASHGNRRAICQRAGIDLSNLTRTPQAAASFVRPIGKPIPNSSSPLLPRLTPLRRPGITAGFDTRNRSRGRIGLGASKIAFRGARRACVERFWGLPTTKTLILQRFAPVNGYRYPIKIIQFNLLRCDSGQLDAEAQGVSKLMHGANTVGIPVQIVAGAVVSMPHIDLGVGCQTVSPCRNRAPNHRAAGTLITHGADFGEQVTAVRRCP